MARAKYPYSSHTSNERAYNYTNLMKSYHRFPSEKQLNLISALKDTCERVGIDITGVKLRTNTMNDARSTINALYTILEKNGYDGWGNPTNLKVYNMYDMEQ